MSVKRKIKKVNDNTGEEMQIWWQGELSMCPALSLFMKVYAETIDKGFSNPNVTWKNSNRVVWAEKEGKIVAGICYEYVQDVHMGWIVLSFTDPDHRGRGINEALHYVMEEDIKQLGGDRISSLVHVDNASRQKSCEKVGLKPQFYRMNKYIK